ncbi:MAG: undecaprenyl-diphosphate phosphatase, partial [Candidatus Moraniibacteriota bacterium]
MSFFDSVILGIVEGLTEFLPISSTGHLILTAHLLQIPESDFLKAFEVAIQLGAILAAGLLYWRKLFLDREIFQRVCIALLPALGVGFIFYATIKKLLGSESIVLWSLLLGGIIIVVFE